MASEAYGVKLVVTADTDEARKEMDELIQKNQNRVQNAVSPASGGSTTDAGQLNAKQAGKRLGQEFNKEVSGKNGAGVAIGKAVAGFILHAGIGTAFSSMRSVGGDNTNVDRAQASFGGAVQYGTAGAMIGGPWGAAIGALFGGASGLLSQYGKERQDAQAAFLARAESQRSAKEGTLQGIGGRAASMVIDWQGDRENRLAWMGEYRSKISRQLMEARQKTSAFNGDTSSSQYKHIADNEQRLQGLYYKAVGDEMSMRMDRLYDPYDGSEFSDAFSKRGLSVGPTVDVGSANSKIIDQQGKMVSCLEKLVDLAIDGNNGGANLEEAINMLSALR